MFDEKIFMILIPLWLAAVAVTLFWGATRPKTAKIVAALLDQGCKDPESAKTLKELGVTGEAFLRKGSAMRRVVSAVDESPETVGATLREAVSEKGEARYYVAPEAEAKARAMYGKVGANIWQALLWAVALTVFFLLLGMLGSAVLDTTGWKPLFRI
jgi:hypothetical protein